MHDLKNRPVAMQEVTYPKKGQTNKRKLMITGVASAAIACLVCLVPASIIFAGAGGAFAVFSGWLGYAAAAGRGFGSGFQSVALQEACVQMRLLQLRLSPRDQS